MELEEQYYPPGFAIFLSFFPQKFLENKGSFYIPVLIDILSLLSIVLFLIIYIDFNSFLYVFCIFLSYPVIALYNTQLTSRGLGNLFYLLSIFPLIYYIEYEIYFFVFLFFSATAFAMMYMTHKMTTQYYFLLLVAMLFFDFDHKVKLFILSVICIGLLISILITGTSFFKMQILTHIDIVNFWYRNWRNLGAHQFQDSNIYLSKLNNPISKFHKGGIKGMFFYLKLIFSYLPHLIILPIFFMEIDLPEWLKIWLIFSVAISFLTLFVPVFRCIGGGHLYLFNSIVPLTIAFCLGYKAFYIHNSVFIIILISILILTTGLIIRKKRSFDDNESENVINFLRKKKKTNIAVFPTTFSDKFAFSTDHKILWGGHNYSLKALEPTWPITKYSISEMFKYYDLNCMAVNLYWWPEIQEIIRLENKIEVLYKNMQWIIFKYKN